MPKNIEDIIVPERRRSIRNIPIPEGRKKNGKPVSSFAPKDYRLPVTPSDNFDARLEVENKKLPTPSWRNRKGIWMAIGLATLILIFAILSIFNGATLTYIPKSATLSFNSDIYKAQKTGEGGLLYSVVKLSGNKGIEVSASGEEEVRRKTSGIIVVYNAATSEAQRLIANTRFETPSGLIYRIKDAIVIPGKKTVSGVVQPGTIEVTVYADEVGNKYNIGLSDFTIPGFAGTPRFTTIYARSKTEMSGGFIGMEKVVKDQDKVQAKARLETALRDELISEAKAQVPEDFILISSLSSVTFEDLPQTVSTGKKDNVVVNLRANLLGVMFKRSDLSAHLMLNKIKRASSESVDIVALDSLDFVFAGTAPRDLLSSEEISFSVLGEAIAVWHTDESALKTDLVGRHKRDIASILNNYPTVLSTTVTIRPFWKNSFPSDSARISIKKLPVK